MKLIALSLAFASTIALGGCAALIPFGAGAAVGTVISNQKNVPPHPTPYIPPRPQH